MPRCHAIGVEVTGCFQEVLELHPLITADAGHGGRSGKVAVGEFVDHRVLEDVFIVQNVVRKAHLLGHTAGIVNVEPSTAGPFFCKGRAVII